MPTHIFSETGSDYIVQATEYVNKKRVEYAIGLLHNTEKQVQTVAYESGFQDPNYFIRVFRKHTGMTPNQYRKTK